jgi:hypothetical protein
MHKHKMLLAHDPENGIWGDCHRTAIAALLDLHPAEVPHFYRDADKRAPEECHAEINHWLGEQYGLRQIDIAFPGQVSLSDVLQSVSVVNPGLTFMLGATSGKGVGHTVVCRDGEIIFDPSHEESGAAGPMSDGHWWVSFLGRAV